MTKCQKKVIKDLRRFIKDSGLITNNNIETRLNKWFLGLCFSNKKNLNSLYYNKLYNCNFRKQYIKKSNRKKYIGKPKSEEWKLKHSESMKLAHKRRKEEKRLLR